MELRVASHNAHKLREIGELLPGFAVVACNPDAEETEETFSGNALIKARAVAAIHKDCWIMADDSGLEVEALNGEPGVRSARYAGEKCDTAANNALLLEKLRGVENRQARFVCAAALIAPDGAEKVVEGVCSGRIADAPSGAGGFGYDPLFIPSGYDKSFAELSAEEKNAISHRGRALAAVKGFFARGV
jgi:XTP/dITP diphosphohydrolase